MGFSYIKYLAAILVLLFSIGATMESAYAQETLAQKLVRYDDDFKWVCKNLEKYELKLTELENGLSISRLNVKIASKKATKLLRLLNGPGGAEYYAESHEAYEREKRWRNRTFDIETEIFFIKGDIRREILDKDGLQGDINSLRVAISELDDQNSGGLPGNGVNTKLDELEQAINAHGNKADGIKKNLVLAGKNLEEFFKEGDALSIVLDRILARYNVGQAANSNSRQNSPSKDNKKTLPGKTSKSAGKKHVHPVKPDVPIARNVQTPDDKLSVEDNDLNPEYNVRYEINAGIVFARLPRFNIGIQSFNTNLTPLHSVKPNIIGAEVGGKLIIDPEYGSGWTGGLGWSYGRGHGSESETIPSFAPGQLPTIFGISGTGGIGINDNSRFKLDIDHFNWKLNGELGYQTELPSGITVKPYVGIFYRHSDTRYKTNIDTDFRGRTFFNTADERIKQDQFGADIGLDFSGAFGSNLTPEAQKLARFFWIAGAHLGAVNTRARYNGSDCGDSNRFTAGCDGGLYLNNNIKAKNNSWDFFGGVKAGLAIYVLCRENPAAVAAAVIDTIVAKLKENCVELSLTGSFERIPEPQINRHSSLGGTMSLGDGLSSATAVTVNMNFSF